MAPDSRALELLEEALDRPADEREAWLTAETRGDPALRDRTLRLLGAAARAGEMIGTEPPAGDLAQPMALPERVGPYRVGAVLGRGGMGEVRAGERADGQFEQSVAIKFIRPGLIAGAARARFAFERQALARLRHPNIAALHDGGALGDGTDFIVMERVDGVAADRWARPTDTRAVVKLVRQVAGAVAHAHANLVLHCDIKAGNVLVTREGTVKLLDFGVASTLGGEGAGGMTPDFAAPEVRGGGAPTTRSDVYGLGRLLASLLGPGAPRDLAAIAARATAISPDRRYETAEAFRHDLDRWLDGRAVRARGGGWAYTARRWARRNRWAAAGAAAALLAVAGGWAATSAEAVRAERARAETQARFDEVRALSRFLLFELYDRLERTPRSLDTRRRVATEAQFYLDRLAATPAAPFDLRLETALGYARLARVQGRPADANLGEPAAAWRNFGRAEAQLGALAAERPARADINAALANVLLDQAWLAMAVRSDLAGAERQLAKARPIIAALRRAAPADRAVAALALREMVHLSDLPQWRGDYAAGRRMAERAVAFGQALGPRTIPEHLQMARAWAALGEALYFGGGQAKAAAPAHAAEYVVATAARARWPGDIAVDRQFTRSAYNHGVTQAELDDPAGLRVLALARQSAERVLAFEPADENGIRQRRTVVRATAEALSWAGRHAEALALFEGDVADRLRHWRARPEDVSRLRDYATSVGALGLGYADAGRPADACARLRDTLALFGEIERRGKLTAFDTTQAVKNTRDAARKACPAGVVARL